MPARFLVRATSEPRAHAHPAPDARSPEDAALLFVERWLPAAEDGEVSVAVVDCERGVEQCFRIHLEDGSIAPC
jgi:hypothetical protein